jgi:predicted TIM-barrel fold metal-dependent hydrolase
MTIPLIDCHQHLIYPDQFPYSWTDGIPALASQSFTYEDYLKQIKGLGQVRTIFMETSPDDPHWQAETQFIKFIAEKEDTLIDGLILNCRPETEANFEAYIASVQHPKLVGFRRILHVVPDDISQSPRFVSNVRKLAAHHLTFDLCFLARQLPLACELADKCPEVQMVLNHCGVPDIAGGVLDPWREHISELAQRPNVACKISGLLAYCAPGNATMEAIQPYVEHCIEAYGWDRLVWGSDWPVVCMTADLRQWIATTRELMVNEDESNQKKLFYRNAERIYLR